MSAPKVRGEGQDACTNSSILIDNNCYKQMAARKTAELNSEGRRPEGRSMKTGASRQRRAPAYCLQISDSRLVARVRVREHCRAPFATGATGALASACALLPGLLSRLSDISVSASSLCNSLLASLASGFSGFWLLARARRSASAATSSCVVAPVRCRCRCRLE